MSDYDVVGDNDPVVKGVEVGGGGGGNCFVSLHLLHSLLLNLMLNCKPLGPVQGQQARPGCG